jgi:hypothetical protein
MTDPLGRSLDGTLNPRITDSPLPAMNDTCPECNTGIVDGSAWRTDPEAATATRVHTHCLNRRDFNRQNLASLTPAHWRVEAMRDEQPEPKQFSNLGMARARRDFDSFASAREEVEIVIDENAPPGGIGGIDPGMFPLRDEQPEPKQAPATHAVDPEQLSNLGMARACLAAAAANVYSNTPAAVSALVGAVNELIQHLQKQETP